MKNRRSDARFFADQPVDVTPLDAADPRCSGSIVDFSASGIALHVPICLAVGSRVEVKWPLGTIVAEVRNCRQLTPSKYRVGLKSREITSLAEIEGQTGAA